MAFDFFNRGARDGQDRRPAQPEPQPKADDQRKKALQELGEWYLHAHGTDAEPEAMEIIRRIRAAENRFRPGGKKACPYCGKLLDEEMLFCIYCGQKQPSGEHAAAPAAAVPAPSAARASSSMFTEEEFGSMFAEDGDLSMFADDGSAGMIEKSPEPEDATSAVLPTDSADVVPAAAAVGENRETAEKDAARRRRAQGFFRAPSLTGMEQKPQPAKAAETAEGALPEEQTHEAGEPFMAAEMRLPEDDRLPFFGQSEEEKTPVDDSDTFFAGDVREEAVPMRPSVCSRCGSPVGPDDLFCIECGNRLK